MHVTIVNVFVKPEFITAFIEETRKNHQGSVQEPGNHRFDVLQHPDEHGHFVLYEAYATEADAKAHKETAHYLAWREAVADMMAKPREGIPFDGLFPQNP